MSKTLQTEDPQERQRLMCEHMASMHQGMASMSNMMRQPGAAACRGDAECRMDRMQAQQQMMEQRMAMTQMMMERMMHHMMEHHASAAGKAQAGGAEAQEADGEAQSHGEHR